jgi:hypothetical protein
MNTEQVLRQRFHDAIRKSFEPCPLVGPKWFNYDTQGELPSFQFTGMSKLAKAVGMRIDFVAQKVFDNLNLRGLPMEPRITQSFDIWVTPKQTPGVPGAK